MMSGAGVLPHCDIRLGTLASELGTGEVFLDDTSTKRTPSRQAKLKLFHGCPGTSALH
jgi:hypothetical protein